MAVHHAEAAEGLLGHHHDRFGHAELGVDEREPVAFVHQVADELKSRAVKPSLSSSAMARQSPSASCMTVEVVGASPCGQASLVCGSATTRSALVPRVLSALEVTAISGTAKRRE